MRAHTKIIWTTLACVAMVAPVATASSANPFPHLFAGFSSAYGDASPYGVFAGLAVVGACADLTPVMSMQPSGLPGDGVPETGVGSACFPYKTVYGDDTGTSHSVRVDTIPSVGVLGPIFLVCIDVNFDGVCTDPEEIPGFGDDDLPGEDDIVRLCYAPNGSGGIRLSDNGPCSVYLTPTALENNPFAAVHVLILPGAIANDGFTIVPSAATSGYISLV